MPSRIIGSSRYAFTPKALSHKAQGRASASAPWVGFVTAISTPKGLYQPPLIQPLRGR